MARNHSVVVVHSALPETPAPIVISLIALSVTFWDRRPRLLVRPRKGSTHNPYKLCPTAQGGLAFLGGIEVYNLSGRPNAIRGYAFWQKNDDGAWIVMESQNYKESSEDETFIKRNETPVTVAPYSGTEVRVLAFASVKHRPSEMSVRIEVEDLFGKRYRIEVLANEMTRCTSKKHLFPAGRKGVVFSFGARASWPTFPVSRRVAHRKRRLDPEGAPAQAPLGCDFCS